MKTSTRDALLILAIGPSLSTTPFASITDVGYYRDTEDTGWHGSLHLIWIKHFSIVKHLTGKSLQNYFWLAPLAHIARTLQALKYASQKQKEGSERSTTSALNSLAKWLSSHDVINLRYHTSLLYRNSFVDSFFLWRKWIKDSEWLSLLVNHSLILPFSIFINLFNAFLNCSVVIALDAPYLHLSFTFLFLIFSIFFFIIPHDMMK
jgi:hypothetical protein